VRALQLLVVSTALAGGWPGAARAQWDSRLELLGSGVGFERREPSPFPEVRLPDRLWQGEVRFDAKLDKGRLSLSAKPRLCAERVESASEPQTDREAFIGQASARLRLTSALSVAAGREILTWGPALVRSPSNPFYPDNGRANPARELPGIDVVRASYVPSVRWGVSLIGHVRQGRYVPPSGTFRRSLTLRLDHNGAAHSASLNVMKAEGQDLQAGAFSQFTVAEPLLLYAEAAVGPPPEPREGTAVTLVTGGTYTLPTGPAVTVEFLRNGNDQRGRPAAALSPASLPEPEAGAETAGLVSNRGAGPLLGRHYVFLQIQSNPGQGSHLWQARYTRSLSDASGQATAYLEWTVFSRVSPFALVGFGHGPRSSEFGAARERLFMAGARIFLW
jgi:hypothetical protein